MEITTTKISVLLITLMLITQSPTLLAQTLEWAKQMGGTNNERCEYIAIDSSGNVYTTGAFQGTADFDPGAGTFNLTSAGGWDIFISKLDASGNFVWAKQMGGTADGVGFSIAIDGSGNLYTTGAFQGSVDFDPGAGTYNLTSAGGWDNYISKLDASGNFVWAKQMGGTNNVFSTSIAIDSSGNVYTVGYFGGTADFDPGAGIFNLTSAGGSDIFISKLDASGNFVWAKQMGGTDQGLARSIAIDGSGNVYTTGRFQGTADFDPGAGTFNLTSAGFSDIFISKLDASGNFVWAKQMGGTSIDYGNSIAIDGSGNVYTTGTFQGTADFDPGAGTFNLTSSGGSDIFISKLDASGNFVWAKQMGGTADGVGLSVAIDGSGNVYTTGYFDETADFYLGAGTFNLTSAGGWDIFISKLDALGNFVWAKQMGGTNNDYGNSIAIDGSGNVYTTGTFQGTADFDPGAGTFNLTSAGGLDIFVHKMSQCINATGIDVITSCTPITWIDGNTYTSSNSTATFNIAGGAANGCDSLVTLNLTINNSATGTDVQTACDSYTWIDGNNYTSSNNSSTFNIVGGAANGCDSLVTLDLTINSTPINTVSVSGITLTADETGATYKWLDCDNGNAPIAGATSQTFTPMANGNYAVEITKNGCTDTSSCSAVITVGINEYTTQSISIYPNPSTGNFTIVSELVGLKYKIIDFIGKVISEGVIYQTETDIDFSNNPIGIYIINIEGRSFKLVNQ